MFTMYDLLQLSVQGKVAPFKCHRRWSFNSGNDSVLYWTHLLIIIINPGAKKFSNAIT